MGKKAIEVVKKAGLDVKKLLDILNRAYCDEWLSYYQYWLGAKLVEGIPRASLEPEMLEHAADELKHAGRLADRIIELGGTPEIDPKNWFKLTNCGYLPPADESLDVILDQNIRSERCAIDVYNDILNYVKGKDMVTGNMVRKIMEEEMDHEEDLQDIEDDIKNFRSAGGKK